MKEKLIAFQELWLKGETQILCQEETHSCRKYIVLIQKEKITIYPLVVMSYNNLVHELSILELPLYIYIMVTLKQYTGINQYRNILFP